MKKIFLSLLFAMGCVFAHAQPMTVPIHTQTAHFQFEDKTPAAMMEIDLNWEIAPATGWGTYSQFFANFESGTGAYMGVQQDDYDGKKILFSLWDASATHKVRPYALPHCRRFDHEGNGGQCILKFQWKTGVKYKLVMGVIPAKAGDVGFVRWGGWIVDSTGVETFIGGYEVPNYNNYTGVGLIQPGTISTVFEYYRAPMNVSCSSLPPGSLTWSGLKVNGSRTPSSVYVNYATGLTECANSDYVRSYVKTIGSITQTTGILNVPKASQGAYQWSSTTTPAPVAPTPTPPVVAPPPVNPPWVAPRPNATPEFLARVACTYDAVIAYYKNDFFKYNMGSITNGDNIYMIGYGDIGWARQNVLISALAYDHMVGDMIVVWVDGTAMGRRQSFGKIEMWMDLAGC